MWCGQGDLLHGISKVFSVITRLSLVRNKQVSEMQRCDRRSYVSVPQQTPSASFQLQGFWAYCPFSLNVSPTLHHLANEGCAAPFWVKILLTRLNLLALLQAYYVAPLFHWPMYSRVASHVIGQYSQPHRDGVHFTWRLHIGYMCVYPHWQTPWVHESPAAVRVCSLWLTFWLGPSLRGPRLIRT